MLNSSFRQQKNTERPHDTARSCAGLRVSLQKGHGGQRVETIPAEVPVALMYRDICHATMLTTPADLEDLALGHSLSEGILSAPSELHNYQAVTRNNGIELHLDIADERFALLQQRHQRQAFGNNLDQPPSPAIKVGHQLSLPHQAIAVVLENIHRQQPLHHRTHAVHAAAWIDTAGSILLLREDIGRHNALDKLVGALSRKKFDPSSGFAFVTSRASVAMVQKAASIGIELLFSISHPTALAVDVAEQSGMTLAGSVHSNSFAIHSHPQRFVLA